MYMTDYMYALNSKFNNFFKDNIIGKSKINNLWFICNWICENVHCTVCTIRNI